ncbi:metallophosphoesterase [Candidatus Woesearchaeota archaeon]|nr:metallophosphoesterase [Candidatus Woesearchaeota archaeon]
MKILACTDVHNYKHALKNIVRLAKRENPDVVVCCGDISNFSIDLEEAIKPLYALNIPFLFIPGNHETVEGTEALVKKYPKIINLHKKIYLFQDVIFFGFGMGGFASREPDLEQWLPKIKKELKDKKSVFITHAPVYGTRLDWLWREHRGNKSARKCVEEIKPVLTLCGHFHENEGKEDKINNTKILNPGHQGKIIEI